MDVRSLIAAAKRNLWLIGTLSILSSICTGIYSIQSEAVSYKTETTLYIMNQNDLAPLPNPSIELHDIQVGRQLATDYSRLLLTRSVLEPAMEQLIKEGVKVEGLAHALSVNLKKDSSIMSIEVTWPDAEQATQIANAVSQSFINETTRMTNSNFIEVLDEARYVQVIRTNHLKNIATSFVVGLLVALVAIYMRVVLDRTIQTEVDIEKQMGVKVIGVIPEHRI